MHSGEANRIVSELEAALDVEARQEAALSEILVRFKARINALNWPDAQKKEFVKGIEEKYLEIVAIRRPMVESEKEFLNSVRDLYLFVLDNQRYFHTARDEVLISDSKVLHEFNERIRHTNELKEKFQTASEVFEQKQRAYFSELGMSARDFGLSR